jgi:hypothetical protein
MTKPAAFTKSYVEVCFHVDGGENIYLRVPSVWDDIQKKWRAFIKTPKTKRLIHASSRDSRGLSNAFIKELAPIMQKGDEFAKEVFDMLKPLSYWEEMSDCEVD